MKKKLLAFGLAVLSTAAYSQDKTLEQRIEDLELSRDLNWVKWGGSLETRYDHTSSSRDKDYSVISTSTGAAQPRTKGGEIDNYYRMWANLNMEAKPSDRLSFFGRLSAAKYFSVLGSDGQPSTAFSDLSDGQSPKSSALFLERAFANYAISDTVTFTMGRLPTIDGPNKHIALNQQLSGNYPTLAYSAILDGFALTKSHKIDGSSSARAKFIYTPTSTLNNSGRVTNGSTMLRDADGNRVGTTAGFFSALGEYEKVGGSFFKKNLTIFQWLHGDSTPFYQAPVTTGLPAGTSIGSDLKVSVDRFVVYSEFEKIFGSEFDFAGQAMYSKVHSRGDITQCTGNAGVCGAADPTTQGWNTNKDDDKMDGYAYALTMRYQTPWKAINRPKVGAEYFYASEKAYVYDAANINPINMYASQASPVYHLFWNQAFDGGLYMNVGYMYQKQTMTREMFGLLGDRVDTKNVNQNFYLSLLATF
jgi:hypothetical protein